jgi:hypothetical protein
MIDLKVWDELPVGAVYIERPLYTHDPKIQFAIYMKVSKTNRAHLGNTATYEAAQDFVYDQVKLFRTKTKFIDVYEGSLENIGRAK